MKIKVRKNNSGFTLIELMVATSIFMVVMLAAMSSLFVMLDAAKSSRALRLAMDNVNFTMESMTRSIRMGTSYYCVLAGNPPPQDNNLTISKDCQNGGTLLSFVPQTKEGEDPARVSYMLAGPDHITNFYTINKCDINGCVSIISPNVNIEKLKFFVNGSVNDPLANTQPNVYIMMKGTVTVKGVPTSFAVQTLASQRNIR